MRLYQLSAVLVSTGILLSGCYLGRPSVDRSDFEHTSSRAQVCEVSALPIAGDVLGALLALPVGVFLFADSLALSIMGGGGGGGGGILLGALAMTGFFAADAVAGAFVVRDCKAAQEEWGIMRKLEAQRKQELTAPHLPETAPQPPSTVPQHPVNQRRHPTPLPKLRARRAP